MKNMISVKGKIDKGKILALEPVDDAFEGKTVTIIVDDESKESNGENGSSHSGKGLRQLLGTIKRNQIHTGITDMAHQHDHYLYGTPKIED
ncbi:MAG: hypothetical protein ACKVRN_09910 [Pyrinomonadaceae bacterium]